MSPREELERILQEQEALVTAAVQKAVAAWLPVARKAVFGTEATEYGSLTAAAGFPPDPEAVASTAQVWSDALQQYVSPVVQDVYGRGLTAGTRLAAAGAVPITALRDAYWQRVVGRLRRFPESAYRQLKEAGSRLLDSGGANADSLRNAYSKVLSRQELADDAESAARVEATSAYNAGQQDGWTYEDDVTGEEHDKIWVAVHDDRTRLAHRDADLQRVPVARPFLVHGSPMMYPGDVAAPIELWINCRCAMIHVLSSEPTPDLGRPPWPTVASGQFHLPGQHDQRDHGKRKRGIPGKVPGAVQGSPTGPTADHSAKWHRDLDDLASLVGAFGGGIMSRQTLNPGGKTSRVSSVQFGSGHDGIEEKFLGVDSTMTPTRMADSEQLSSALGRALGVPVPRVLRTDADTVVMDRIPGQSGAQTVTQALAEKDLEKRVTRVAETKKRLTQNSNAVRLGLLDVLAGNEDSRELDSWVVLPSNGQPASATMATSWDETHLAQGGSRPPAARQLKITQIVHNPTDQGTISAVSEDVLVDDPGTLFDYDFAAPFSSGGKWTDNPLTSADVDFLRAQLDDLKDDFAALDRAAWWQFASDRLEAIRPHARGSQNLFAPTVSAGQSQSGVGGGRKDFPVGPTATFHLPGLHDQESHGNWSTGGSREYTGPRWQLPDSVTAERFDRLRQAARKYARLSRMDGVAWNDERKRKANDELFAAQEGWPYANPEDQVARARAMREGQLLASLDEWRESNGIDEPEDKLLDRLAEETRQAFAGKKVAVRVTDAQLGRILERGRFSTQFESKRSKGLNDNGVRAEYEAATFGFAADVPPDQRAAHSPETRPVYGYVMVDGVRPAGLGSKDLLAPSTDALSQYGRVQVVLRDDVRERTTAMYGDGLNNGANGAPSAINDPTWEAFTPSWKSMVGTAFAGPTREPDSQFFRSSVYAEAQIHGGVSVDDIEEVVFPANPSAALRKQLDDAGVKWRVHSYSTAATADDPAERAQALKQALQDQQFLRAEIAESTDKIEQYRARNDSYTVNQLEKEVALLQKQLAEVEKALPKLQEAGGVVAAGAPAEGQLVARRGDGAELVTAGGEAAMLLTDAGRYLTTVTSAVARGDDWVAVDPAEEVQVSPDELSQLKQYDQELAVAGTVAVLTASGATFHLPGQHDQRTHGHGKGKYFEGGDMFAELGVPKLERKLSTFRKRYKNSRSPDAAVLAHMQKFDGQPNIVPAEQLDEEIAGGRIIEMHRAVASDGGGTGGEYAEAFRRGDAFYGAGGYGSGMYFATDPGGTGDGTQIRAGLRSDARIIAYDDLDALYRAETEGPERDPRLARSPMFEDPGLYALALGYDAIAIPKLGGGGVVGYNVLNRTAMWVEESPLVEED